MSAHTQVKLLHVCINLLSSFGCFIFKHFALHHPSYCNFSFTCSQDKYLFDHLTFRHTDAKKNSREDQSAMQWEQIEPTHKEFSILYVAAHTYLV